MVQIVQRLSPGGIETLSLDLASRLPGVNPVLSLDWSTAQIRAHWPATASFSVEGLEKPAGLQPAFVLRLARRLRALKPRAVVTHHIGPLLYGGLAARLAGVPVVAYVEHDVWHYGAPRRRQMARVLSALVRPRVVAVSEGVAKVVRGGMPCCRVRVIRNAIDTDRFRPADQNAARESLGLPLRVPLVGTAGRMEEVKGHDVLIAAMTKLPGVHLALVGHGSREGALRAQAAALGLANRVIFLGHRGDMPAVYPAFDVMCLPSRNEGLPLSVLEAQACGVPVVASRVGSVEEGICPESGELVPPGDPAALAGALQTTLQAPRPADLRAFVLDHFSWDRMVAAYEELTDLPRP
ncbi:glycosyltransferase [Aquabacter sp. L1I39]|uniref:glycosyltransferase n=1 Tax=Aquabacter sp. L1I39 TaxID=2820278 RepID=UPI001ADAABAA|nr:glycosyltransferase [Aquabacter sp. L1I39]QTL05146.1 glycosyltransferase [Aquabacter sp. L1I39]